MQGMVAHTDFAYGPLYKRVKMLLTQSLAAGAWKPSEAIPSETRLADQFNVSIGTVRKAIDELVAEKILVRQQGRGTFVASHTEDRFLFHFFHIVGEDGAKQFPVAELLEFRKERAEPDLAERLGLARGGRVIHIRNVLHLQERPIQVDDIYISALTFPGLTREMFANRLGTIYQLYQDHFGINIIRTSERLRAAAATETDGKVLGTPAGAPVLQIDRTAFTFNDIPVEVRKSHVNTAHHVYLNDLDRIP